MTDIAPTDITPRFSLAAGVALMTCMTVLAGCSSSPSVMRTTTTEQTTTTTPRPVVSTTTTTTQQVQRP
jgi:hypothetical protein